MSDTLLPQLLTIDEVAQVLQVAKKTLRRWERSGIIKSVRTPGNQRRFERGEVERMFKKRPPKIKQRSNSASYRVPYRYVNAYKALFLLIVVLGFGGIIFAIEISHSTSFVDQKTSRLSGAGLSLQTLNPTERPLMADRGLEQNRLIQLTGEIPSREKKPWLNLEKISVDPIIESQSLGVAIQSPEILAREHGVSEQLALPGEPQWPVSVEKLGTKNTTKTSLE